LRLSKKRRFISVSSVKRQRAISEYYSDPSHYG
jgi:hypothetical protein